MAGRSGAQSALFDVPGDTRVPADVQPGATFPARVIADGRLAITRSRYAFLMRA